MFLKNGFGKDIVQIVAIIAGCLTSCTCGMLLAWPSPFIVKIANDKDQYDITEYQASFFPIWYTIGTIVSLPFAPLLPDRIGRKPTILLTAVPYTICWILKLFFRNLYVLYCARFVGGCGDAFLLTSLPLYIGEIATPEVRGVWGNGLMVFGYFGQFLMNVIGSYLNVQKTSIVSLTVPVIFVFLFSLMPESPYYYAMKGKDEEGRRSLQKLRREKNIDAEYNRIKFDVQRQMSESGTFKDLFFIKSNRRALIAGLFLRVSQMFSGFFVFISYTQFIFSKTSSDIAPSTSAIIYSGIGVVAFLFASVFSDRLGRKKSLKISYSVTSVILLLEGTYFLLDEYFPEVDLSNVRWFPLLGLIAFLVFASFGLGLLPSLMLSELFSASVKARAISVVIEMYAITYLMMNSLFYYLTSTLGICVPFFVFGCSNMISAVLSSILVPETKGKTLETIQQNLKSK